MTVTTMAPWRNHFSENAGDLIAIHQWIAGDAIAQRIILEAFKRRPHSGRINETTVLAVLSDLQLQIEPDGTVTVGNP